MCKLTFSDFHDFRENRFRVYISTKQSVRKEGSLSFFLSYTNIYTFTQEKIFLSRGAVLKLFV